MQVPLRLRTIAKFVKPGEKVADVGADHGILELLLISRKTNNEVVAIENKKGPYEILKENLIGIKNIRLSLSDGLTAVDKNVDTVVIAGMGGINIVNILKEYPEKVRKLDKIIVDPHRDNKLVRTYLTQEMGYKITHEKIVRENEKFYVITVFENKPTKIEYDLDSLEFGYKIYKDKLWDEYKNYLIFKYQRNMENIKSPAKIKMLKQTIERLENYGKNQTL